MLATAAAATTEANAHSASGEEVSPGPGPLSVEMEWITNQQIFQICRVQYHFITVTLAGNAGYIGLDIISYFVSDVSNFSSSQTIV